ncbi:MAG: hypothetical protein POH28_10790, partial [Acidocella sp.]|nr:hypothetical protein [Acidocella sp.]
QAGNYAGAIATIKTHLADDARFHPVLLQSYYQMGNCTALEGAVNPALMHAARTGHAPPQADLQMVADCYAKAKDMGGYANALIPLVQYYPSPTYWGDVLGLMQADPAYSDRLALDFFRLKQAVGIAGTEPDYMEYAEEAAQLGLDNEAAKIMAAGKAAGVLGSGPDADRQGRLVALIAKREAAAAAGAAQQIVQARAAKDDSTLFDIGFNQVEGGDSGGLALMAEAIRSGNLTHAPQAELEMGMAYASVGQQAYAQAMWKAVPEGSPAGKLAKLWMLVK